MMVYEFDNSSHESFKPTEIEIFFGGSIIWILKIPALPE